MSVYDVKATGAPLFNGNGWANTSLIQSEPFQNWYMLAEKKWSSLIAIFVPRLNEVEEGGYCISHRPSFRPYGLNNMWLFKIRDPAHIIYHFGPPSLQTRRGTPGATRTHFFLIDLYWSAYTLNSVTGSGLLKYQKSSQPCTIHENSAWNNFSFYLPIYRLKHMTCSQVNVKKGAEHAPYMASTNATTEIWFY